MSGDVRATDGALDRAEIREAIVPWSLEVHADALMDELFTEVEQMLEDVSAVTESSETEAQRLERVVPPPAAAIATPPLDAPQSPSQPQTRWQWPKMAPLVDTFLIGSSCLSLSLSIGILLIRTEALSAISLSPSPTTGQQSERGAGTTALTGTSPDPQFSQYLLRSLQRIDQKATAPPPLLTEGNLLTALLAAEPSLPANPEADELTQALNRLASALEKNASTAPQPQSTAETVTLSPPPATIPVPISTPPPPPIAAVSPALPQVTPASPEPVPPAAPPPPPQPAKPEPPASKTTKGSPAAAITSVRPSAAPENDQSSPPPPDIAASSPHVLIGVLEFGDRSAALVDTNGQVKRVTVGESIGASGWVLTRVSDQEATIQREDQTRLLSVGQRF